jgi:acetyl-CoA synthetase
VPDASSGRGDGGRGELVKACIVLRDGTTPDEALRAHIQDYVKSRLSGHEYPRVIEFRDSLPMTVTGKIRRKDLRDEAMGATDGTAV